VFHIYLHSQSYCKQQEMRAKPENLAAKTTLFRNSRMQLVSLFLVIINPLRTKRIPFYLKTQSVPRSKTLAVPVIKTSQLMLYREIIAVCSEIRTKHINTLCGQNVEFVNVN
jgi:hypothetical protein